MTIKLPEYEVWVSSRSQIPTAYSVRAGKDRPNVSTFPVSEAHSAQEQMQRAYEYCNYMNKIVAATEEAYAQTQLVDVLKR